MCTCASCSYTDRFGGLPDLLGGPVTKDHKHGWEYWPRGAPSGPASSAAAYRAHVAHSRLGAKAKAPPPFRLPGLVYPVKQDPLVVAFVARMSRIETERKKAEAQAPARPAQPGKAEQHFPGGDRPAETATIYAMPKSKPKRASVGRPPLPGRRVVVKLEERQIKAAEKLGGGNIAAGIRKALQSA